MKTLALFIILFSMGELHSQWVKQNSLTYPKTLNQFDFTDVNTGWAVGDSGRVMNTTNGGMNWNSVSLNTNINFRLVQFANANTGYIAGDSGRVYKTINAGVIWNQISTGTDRGFFGMYFTDASTGYVGGMSIILKTTNGGSSWNTQFNNGSYNITDLFFLNGETGWANLAASDLLKTTNGGTNWVDVGSSVSGQLYFLNENTGWAFPLFPNSSGPLQMTVNGGSSWSVVPGLNNMSIYSIRFVDANTGYGAGILGMIRTTDAGASWVKETSEIFIRHIDFENQTGWGIGSTGSMIKSTNNGVNWGNISPDINTGRLYSAKFFNANTGYVMGTAGTFAKTTNGGTSWERKNMNTVKDMTVFQFIDNMTGWALHQTGLYGTSQIYKTTTGGDSWQQTNLNTNKAIYTMHFVNPNTGWVVGDSGTVLKSTNGGADWQTQSVATIKKFLSVRAFDVSKVVISSPDGGLYTTFNGGSLWTPYNEFNNTLLGYCDIINSTTAYIAGVDTLLKTTNSGGNWFNVENSMPPGYKPLNFINENLGYTVRGQFVYKTEDGGVNWEAELIENSQSITNLSFINANTGWVVGENGGIYKTTNGTAIGIHQISSTIPKDFSLGQNYPNPFNPNTTINFDIPKNAFVEIKVFDVLGREVASLVNEQLAAGKYKTDWNAPNYTSGIYFYRLNAGSFSETRKMILIK